MTDPHDVVVAVDTSVAVPLIMLTHGHHPLVRAATRGLRPRLTGQSLAETYAVLTRLPGDARVSAEDAVQLIDTNFGAPVTLSGESTCELHRTLGRLKISGGAVYDGLVALTAREHGLKLMTRDARAVGTYALVGVETQIIN